MTAPTWEPIATAADVTTGQKATLKLKDGQVVQATWESRVFEGGSGRKTDLLAWWTSAGRHIGQFAPERWIRHA